MRRSFLKLLLDAHSNERGISGDWDGTLEVVCHRNYR